MNQPNIAGISGGGFVIFDAGMPGLLGPTVINAYTTLSIPPYWRAMNFIANNMASFPRSVALCGVAQPHKLDPVIKRRPNRLQNSSSFWRTLFFHRSHYGNGFARIYRDSQLNPIGLENRLPELTLPFVWTDENENDQLYYYIGGRKSEVVPSVDMIHLSGLSYDGLAGFNPVFLLSEAFERARTVDRYITRFLVKGTVMRGAIEIPTGVGDDQVKKIIDTIKTFFTGADAARDTIVLSDGAKLNNATLSNNDSQLVQLASYTTKQVSQITGVPPVFLFDQSEAKYNSTVEQAWDMVVSDLFRPLIFQDESELSMKLLSLADQNAGLEVSFDANALIRGDTQTISATAIAQRNAGIITANEARKRIGEPQSIDPAADKLMVLGSTAPQGGTGGTSSSTTPPPKPSEENK